MFDAPKYDLASDPILSQFPPWSGRVNAGFHAGYLGEMTDAKFINERLPLFKKIGAQADTSTDRRVVGTYPHIGEELFEWRALLTAVMDAKDRFVMVDTGSGFGRWLVSAVCALRHHAPMLPFDLVGVEAEATHFKWATEHLFNNAVDPVRCRLLHAAVGAADGTVEFLYGPDASAWYGQTMANTYHGQYAGGRHQVTSVKCVSLGTLLADFDRVDFLNIDIQGAEDQAVVTGINAMTRKVRRAYVGTHAPHLDQIVACCFASRGWECVAQFPCESAAETEFGRIQFNQGIQHWINPRV